MAEQAVLAALQALSIDFQSRDHKELPTVDDHVAELCHLDGAFTKNLVFKDKKEGLFLVTAAASTTVDSALLGKKLAATGICKKYNLRFAGEDVLTETLQVHRIIFTVDQISAEGNGTSDGSCLACLPTSATCPPKCQSLIDAVYKQSDGVVAPQDQFFDPANTLRGLFNNHVDQLRVAAQRNVSTDLSGLE